MNFENQVAISTGAASGMGLLFAENFAALGGNVVLCDVNEAVLNKKVAAINARDGGRAIGVVCDVRDYAQICALRDRALEAFGRIDVAASFAGGASTRVLKVDKQKHREFPDVPIEVYDWGLDVNLKAPFYLAHAVFGVMREQKSGFILNVGSITGAEGSGYNPDYATAKAGLMNGLTKSLAQAGAPHNVRCNCIAPGPVLTRPEMANMKTPMGRAAEPQEVIDLALFLLSEKGQFINGETILIDGGRNAMSRKV